ncbi:MAG: hypothetical protein COB98_09140 [Flavobacteriaceae bacterium]|nr:MAG: hypothetical protein COB98_09140 [Flavobacteriaceae bacterium]
MNKIKIIGAVVLLISQLSIAQQDPQYTQYTFNMNVINPAYAGSKGTLSFGLLGRTQWVGVEGAPRTITASMNAPLSKNVGIGLSVIADEIGPAKEQSIFADFSYSLKLDTDKTLAFGIKAGISFLNVGLLNYLDTNEDLNVPINQTSPNFGFGTFYHTAHFYLGVAIPNLLKTRYIDIDKGELSTASERMHYFITSGYVIDMNDTLKLKPSVLIKAVAGAPLSIDISANAMLSDKVEFGLTYRLDDSVGAMAAFNINLDMRIGYAFDYTTSNMGDYNSGSHEIFLLYDLRDRRDGKSPRFF